MELAAACSPIPANVSNHFPSSNFGGALGARRFVANSLFKFFKFDNAVLKIVKNFYKIRLGLQFKLIFFG
jgi:hypothetical protein